MAAAALATWISLRYLPPSRGRPRPIGAAVFGAKDAVEDVTSLPLISLAGRPSSRSIAFAADPSLPLPLAMLKGVWSALATGYVSNTGDAATDALLSRGGMAHMLPTVWLIMAALAFGAIVEHAGLLKVVVDPVAERVAAIPALIASVVASAFAANVMTADQYMAIALPGRMFRAVFEKRGYAPVVQTPDDRALAPRAQSYALQ